MTFDKGGLPTRDGQMVRVVLEGPARNVGHVAKSFGVGDGWGRNGIYPDAEHVVSIEVEAQP